jgi:acetoin utilization protein AcuC
MNGKAAFVYSDALSGHVLRADHPLRAVRLRYTYDLLRSYGAFEEDGALLLEPRHATDEELATLHTREYIEAVKRFGRGDMSTDPSRFNFSVGGDNPIYDGMYGASTLSTGASMVAAEVLEGKRASVAFSISGGLHHAAAGNASGFCVFNDPAVAINYLLSKGLRAVYVDIDVHHGDGVQAAFYDSDRVLTISIHESGAFLFPGTGSVEETGSGAGTGYSVNLPLYPYTEDDTYLWAFREVVPPLVEAFKPDVLVTQLGIDSYYNDPLAHVLLTSRGYVEAVREFAGMGLPWLATGGGGYDVGAVARCWTMAYGVMLGVEWPDEIPAQLVETYGYDRLRDAEAPFEVPEKVRQEARSYAEDSVEKVKRLIFPVHRID